MTAFEEREGGRFFEARWEEQNGSKTSIAMGFTTVRLGIEIRGSFDLDEKVKRVEVRDSAPFLGSKIAYAGQSHSDRVAVLATSDMGGFSQEGFIKRDNTDGLLTREKGISLVLLTADCLSLFVIAPVTPSAIAIAHAGWKGSQIGISRKLISLLEEQTNLRPSHYHVFLGPAIRSCCYHVGDEFHNYFPASCLSSKEDPSARFDLVGENRRQLIEAGVREENIVDCGLCTHCRSDLLYSYRRQAGQAGRMISWIVKQ